MTKIGIEPITSGAADGAERRRRQSAKKHRLPVKQVSYAPLHEVVYHEIRRALMQGRFEPGQRMTVRGLADALGTSHMPVRAALSRLIAEKAFIQVSQRFIGVPVVSVQKFKDLMEIRRLLEGEAVARSATRMPAGALDETRAIGERLNAAIDRNDTAGYLELNQELKFSIYAHCGSPTLLSLIEMLWLQVGPVLRFFSRDLKSLPEINFHGEVIAAIHNRDAEVARVWIQRDIKEGMQFLLIAIDFPKDAKPEK